MGVRLGRLLCKHGYHSWGFLWMANQRPATIPPWTDYICEVGERCRRAGCRLRRTRKNVPVPKKVRT